MLKRTSITVIVLSVTLAAQTLVQAKSTYGASLLQSEKSIQDTGISRSTQILIKEIRHELLTLPFYDVFDWLEGEVRADGTVALRGYVVRPTTKSEAEARIKDIEGVERVVNEIEVLPVSQNDDRLRLAIYRALFSQDSPLFRYGHRAMSPIHIIVKNGRAILKGVVATEQEKKIAYTRARSVPGLFEVKDELRIEK